MSQTSSYTRLLLIHSFLSFFAPNQEQYEFCYDILNQLVSTKLGFPSTESGNAHIDNPEVLGTNNPNPEGMVYTDLSDIDHPDVSETANMTDSATR